MTRHRYLGSYWLIRPNQRELGRARARVYWLLRRAGVDAEARERAVIAADELLSNAMLHVGQPAVLSACVTPDAVRVCVSDVEPGQWAELWQRTTAMSGLTLVRALSSSVYVNPARPEWFGEAA